MYPRPFAAAAGRYEPADNYGQGQRHGASDNQSVRVTRGFPRLDREEIEGLRNFGRSTLHIRTRVRMRLGRLHYCRSIIVKLKLGRVLARWNDNPEPVTSPFGVVVARQALSKTVHLNADNGVLGFLEILRLSEDVNGDGVFSDLFGTLQHGFAADVLQQTG